MPTATLPPASTEAVAPATRRDVVPRDHRHGWRKVKSGLASTVSLLCALVVMTPLGLVLGYLLIKGASSLNLAFFFNLPAPVGEVGGGVANAIVGTFVVIGIASIIGVPVGIFGAIYLTEYGGRRFNSVVRLGADILNGIPSIVWGIVAYSLLVNHDVVLFGHTVWKKGFSAFAGGVALAFILIPMVLRTTEEVLLLVPNGYREAATALGINRWRICVQIVAKTALKGIVTGVMLAVARIAGETAPLLFTALGNRFWSFQFDGQVAHVPHEIAQGFQQPIAALPLQIFAYAIAPYEDWHRQAWAAALVLILLVLGLNVGLRFLTRDRVIRSMNK